MTEERNIVNEFAEGKGLLFVHNIVIIDVVGYDIIGE